MAPGSGQTVTVFSVAFAYKGATDAVLLRDWHDNRLVARRPEWSAAGRRMPAAYVRGAQPTVRVVLSLTQRPRSSRAPSPVKLCGSCTISATGIGGPGIEPRKIALSFDASGRTAPIDLHLSEPLPNRCGQLQLRWRWQLRIESTVLDLGETAHQIWLSARPVLDPGTWLSTADAAQIREDAGDPDWTYAAPWTYAAIMEWTSSWCADKTDEKAIVDAIMEHLPETGLRYAVTGVSDIRTMLNSGGAFCGVWAQMFAAMAASQGVSVSQREVLVDWRVMPRRMLWPAMEVRNPGINRDAPAFDPRGFNDARWPVGDNPDVQYVVERRYYFWGKPGGWDDGHVFDILTYNGVQYLYDPSFSHGPIRLDKKLPEVPPDIQVDAADLGTFTSNYLRLAVDFMLGALPWGPLDCTTDGAGQPSPSMPEISTLLSTWAPILRDVILDYGLSIPTSDLKRRGDLTVRLI